MAISGSETFGVECWNDLVDVLVPLKEYMDTGEGLSVKNLAITLSIRDFLQANYVKEQSILDNLLNFVKGIAIDMINPVIKDLNLDVTVAELAENIGATSPTGTSLINIKVDSFEPTQAAKIANSVALHLIDAVKQLSPADANNQQLVRATLISPAQPPASPSSPKWPLNLAVGFLGGLLIGVAQAVLRQVLDRRIHGSNDIASITPLPIMATISMEKPASNSEADSEKGFSYRDEEYRRLRTNLQFLNLDDKSNRTFVITSSVPGEGKTSTAIGLAKAIAASGETVLLVDADLRKPRVADALGLGKGPGLMSALTGRVPFDDLAQSIPDIPRLTVLTAGRIPPNPSEILQSVAMRRFLDSAGRRFSYVILDTPPVLPVTDGVILSKLTSGALLVARSQIVQKNQLAAALEALENADANVHGIVLNGVKHSGNGEGYYGGGYYGEYQEKPEPKSKRGK
jgi:capsular exopolysaccharide synthesis family protein